MGEPQVRGVWVIRSYFKTLNRENFTEDGWFRMGDVSTIYADGYMTITDHTKNLTKSGGEWISSVSLESALMAHPKIKEAAVIAIHDKKWSERPLATIVFADKEDTLSEEELKHFISLNFVSYQIPDKYVFIDQIPRTSVGKFDTKEIRGLISEGELT